MNQEYKKYLSGKSVSLVGPANYLSKLKLGDEIDSSDIVVRVNRGMELLLTYPESLGKKTDILYNCLIDSCDNGGHIDVGFYKMKGVEWISTIPGSKPTGECTSSSLHKQVKPANVELVKKYFNFHVMDHELYAKLNKSVDCRANTGFSAIFDLLDCDISRLSVYGFSFYLDNFINGYKSGCDRDDKEFARQCFISKRHNQNNQWSHLKNMYNEEEKLEVDPVLKYILSMKELSRDEFRKNDNLYTD